MFSPRATTAPLSVSFGNRTLVDALYGELVLELVPGVLLQLLVTQREAAVLLVDLQYDDLDVGTYLRKLTRDA